jgi:hypothetical protein
MSGTDSAKPGFMERAKHEFIDYVVMATYLALFFCALTTYTMLLLRKYNIDVLNYSFAIINAFVIAKVIMIGELAHLGRSAERRPLYQTVFYKAFVYGLLVLAFHFVEEFVKRLIHGKPFGAAWHETNVNDLVGRGILIFCCFVPMFAFRELRRVLGAARLYALFRTPGAVGDAGVSAGD